MKKETIKNLNSNLIIVRFGKSWAFKHPEYGYLGFLEDNAIYTPIGGANALNDILKAGGFVTFENMFFVNFEKKERYLFK